MLHLEPVAFYGIEKDRSGVEIRCFECRENRRFSYFGKFSKAISEKSLKSQNLTSRSFSKAKNRMRAGKYDFLEIDVTDF